MVKNSSTNLFTLFLLFAFVRSSLSERAHCVEDDETKDELPGYELVLVQMVSR